ncbi:hypothetical protein HB778_38470 (plasmid) [Mesorhizobium huakuii]|uniref:Uncharacterized protein n=1 Tax=Mesorhizobium huakuii TaxID=28104 RepID=A0A7G6T5I0_9HYPH|nr:hypothetical protein [Mesorhizobium huakuii]QND62012.1 hypothetical protein HB778_38470 [Mesorhizobium huakuii]
MQLADNDPGQTGRVNAHGNERLLPGGQFCYQKCGVSVYGCASKVSVLLHHYYRRAGFAIANRSHPLDPGIAVDANIEQNRPCGFFCGVSHTITEGSIEALDIPE